MALWNVLRSLAEQKLLGICTSGSGWSVGRGGRAVIVSRGGLDGETGVVIGTALGGAIDASSTGLGRPPPLDLCGGFVRSAAGPTDGVASAGSGRGAVGGEVSTAFDASRDGGADVANLARARLENRPLGY